MLKIMVSILVFAAAAGMAGTYKRELADHLALLYALRKLLVDLSCYGNGTRQPVEVLLGCFVIHQYGNQIRHVVLDTLKSLGVQNVKIKIVDKGALDCTIRARVEAAVYRSAGQSEQLPWGGAIR